MSRSSKPDLTRMLTLLEQERKALRAYDLDRLSRLAPRKEALLARLEAGIAPQDGAESLVHAVRDGARENAQLYQAAIQGLQDARSLITRCTAPPDDRTYSRDGARQVIDPPAGTVQRRA
ncbi:hypothetical protein [Pararhodobacter oceanensis]|uniref:Flagellar protein FlgN n=1 Tax=Pararhodobacter oceanensis TaxID=2172121 RepID=A0A2T8HSV8_9RHOB|nr:hypothetical protein [Pararhodobacter oceanensis]PVH28505.1 hypothetical protein DDE20_13125 [Pararhodobacter oceanensis]